MLKTEDNSDFGLNDDPDNSSMDVVKFFAILSEESDPSNNYFLNNSEYLLSDHFQAEVPHVEVNHERSSQPQNAEPCRPSMWHHSDYQEPSEFRPRMGSGCLSDFRGKSDTVEHEKMETLPLTESPLHSSVSLAEWSASYAEHDTGSSRERVGSSINAHLHSNADSKMLLDYITNYNMALNFVAGHANHASSCADHMDSMQLKSENGYEFKHDGGDSQPKFASHLVTNLTMNSANQTALSESCVKDLETHERYPCTSLDEAPSRSVEMVFPDVTQSELNNDSEVSGVHFESSNYCSEARPHSGSVVDNGPFSDLSKQFLPRTYDFPAIVSKRENMFYVKDEVGEALTGASLQESTLMDCASIGSCQDTSFKWEDGSPCSAIRRNSFDADDKTSVIDFSQSLVGIPSLVSSKGEIVCIEDGRHDKLLASKSFSSHSSNFIDVTVADIGSPISEISAFGADHASSDLMHIELLSKKKPTVGIKDEKEDKLILHRSMTSQAAKLTGEVWGSGSIRRSHIDVDADADVCILEDISDPRRPPSVAVNGKSLPVVVHGRSVVTSQSSAISDPHHHTGMGGTRLKINDERLTFRAALQGLSQPKAEAAPPDGVLAVSLLRHQRIALSWMMQKETASLHCSGGILADDQGLGKTISTIALILKERPPSSKMSSTSLKRDESEALNLDEDDDSEACQLDGSKQDGDSGYVMVNGGSLKNKNAVMPRKGRPAAGTLIVCPTSVLRQWADELHNKVTREANLSVLVYHGSNRTKDPLELAKYDVVLTTYSIVSMEVPKQPLVDKDDDDQGKQEGHSALSVEFSSSRKRKYAPSSDKKSGKNKKGMDGALLEAVALPLARVGWFRVVLDEAQSIKNHRTQVARACWGLRAKRRWCLSGTPIQNAVDDLYSYFRFLRYDPYAAYKSFCSMIKVPITRNPTNGYKKLQLVLKTIMLRRTKGTFIDGQPIISLPPKSVELKKVDFSKEERDFYSKLEADSRAQFKVYAAAGTVKQNYVNILLMLLRLRQACDHPLLVKGYDSNSVWRSSIQMAKKLPREQQIDLLNCLEASLAICGICNDPPKDAVVTICRHVFCNQCICEHLTIDDHLCPAAQCKDQLNVTSVFSRATLKSSLFEQPDHSDSADKSTSQFVETLEPFSEGLADSSKIKAAVEILQAISKPRQCASDIGSLKSSDEIPTYLGNDCDSLAVGSFNDIPKVKHDETEKLCDDSSNKIPEKAIVFSQWTRMLDLLESRLKESSILYRRLDGTMSVMARDKAVKDFNTLPEVSVMIMSLKAASLGLNMVAACHVLLLDLWWNPTTEDQAIDRAHRIGQTRPVTVLRLTVKDTVEDRILALQQKKREMVASAFGEDETGGRQTRLTVDDLSYLFMV